MPWAVKLGSNQLLHFWECGLTQVHLYKHDKTVVVDDDDVVVVVVVVFRHIERTALFTTR